MKELKITVQRDPSALTAATPSASSNKEYHYVKMSSLIR